MRSCDIILSITLLQFSFIICAQLCDNDTIKCRRGLQCIKKNETVSICRKRCPIKWSCYEENKNSSNNLTISTIFTDTSNNITESNNSSRVIETSETTVSVSSKGIESSSSSMIEINNFTSFITNSTEKNVINQCKSCSDGMNCFLVENSNYRCANECDPNWECNKIKNQNSTITFEPLISEQEFNNAMSEAGYYIFSARKYNYIVNLATKAGNITTKRELAMFLAQILWESDGLKAVREYACLSGCPNEYKTSDDVPGKSYYGRGYIQLTWAGNYKSASYDLFNDDRLYKNPDLVAENEELSWATAFWYWKKHVKPRPGIELGYFGEATDAINGKLECFNGPNVHKAKLRFILYKKILKGLNIKEEPIEKGCY